MRNSTLKITLYTDPGHGWGLAKREQLVKLGIIDQITPYSYQRGENVYLEEDHDLSIFCKALKERNVKVSFDERHTDKCSKIRGYASFRK